MYMYKFNFVYFLFNNVLNWFILKIYQSFFLLEDVDIKGLLYMFVDLYFFFEVFNDCNMLFFINVNV